VILMIVGAVGLIISLFYMSMWADRRRQTVGRADRGVVREPVARDPDVY
jgi:FtsZ-interacting cell division protein ZipA